jgi:DNA replication and repair protein RecF
MDKRPDDAFPQAGLAIEGELEAELAAMPALEAEDRYRDRLAAGRGADRAAGRTLVGPHRSDLTVTHIAKQQGARLCSTGEQKILLAGLVLAHAALVREMNAGFAPILLLDEVAAHLDTGHRLALFEEIARLGCQAWMTGTDDGLFDAVDGDASRYRIEAGELSSQAAR